MAKHSPGPWTLERDGRNRPLYLISGDGHVILSAETDPHLLGEGYDEYLELSPADAALIASAPTMAAEIVELKKRLALVGAQLRSKDAELQSKGGA